MNYIDYFESIKNKTIAVVGIGVSNKPLIQMLLSYGIKVSAFDKNAEKKDLIAELNSMGVETVFGDDYLEHFNHDIIFKSPGIRDDIPQFIEAKAKGSIVTSEMEVFFELCPCEIFAVTGSDGKTTTTTLIYEILNEQGYKCHLGGNIGKPLLPEIANISKEDKVILELSSFQLKTIKKSPHISVITNLSPNHLDWHKDMDEYLDSKKNIFRFQNESDFFVTNADNEITRELYSEARGKVRNFSRLRGDTDLHLDDGCIYYGDSKIVDTVEILLPGVHNVENYMAAIGAVIDYVEIDTIRKVATTFAKIPHRIEFIRELSGVKYYNDSIASSPTRSIAGLKSFKNKVILIAGGYDKNLDYDILGPVICEKVKKLVLVGKTSDKIEASTKKCKNYNSDDLEIIKCSAFDEALYCAKNGAKPGDIIILSPASASFDMFDNFEQRGNVFKDLVNGLME
ncbi:MAG: UDP-N-acetylmuramoyl-L-alanine--D-glutamate ligase [Clostridia bacterium]|nr:UDP-N-acetylmuramoyl-L-alanine--D-glutamate ligase [Clostridia bacterium]